MNFLPPHSIVVLWKARKGIFMEKEKDKQVAVLIDGDNISSKYAEYIMQEASQYGNIIICRLYGSINCPSVKSWYKIMPRYGIMPVLQISYASGKSIADQALTIDAMDILYTGNVDVFCLISSDSDFTKLVYRIKENGALVVGMGEQKTKESLANSCDEFKILDLIYRNETEEAPVEENETEREEELVEEENDEEILEEFEVSIPPEDKVIGFIQDLMDTTYADDEKVNLSKIGISLSKKWSGFDARNYGYKNIRQLINGHDNVLRIDDEKAPDGVHNISYVRKK